MFVYKSVYTPQNEQYDCPWKWWLGNGNYFLFGATGLIFKGIRCWFLGKVRVFGKHNSQMTWTCFHWNPDWFRFRWSLFPLRNNPGIKQGRISFPKKITYRNSFDPKHSNTLVPCSSEMDVQVRIYLNLPDTKFLYSKNTAKNILAEWGSVRVPESPS